jgi:phosphoglycolate phosphatase
MKKYSLLLFDFDGTLVDTVGDIAYYVNRVLAEAGYSRHDVEEVKRAIGLGVHELFHGLEPKLELGTQRLEQMVESFKAQYRMKPVRETKPYPHVLEMLAGKLADTPKAIVTNKPQDITEQILRELGMSHHFQYLIGMHAGYPPKPDPAAMEFIIAKLDQPKNGVVYLGDSRVDSMTCQNAAVDFVWMDYGYDHLEADNYLHRFSSALDWAKLIA